MTEKIPKEKIPFVAPEKYIPHDVIGSGGMKTIIRAEDVKTGREVAIAIAKDTSENNLRRFVDEAKLTAVLEHPNIIPVHDIGEGRNGIPYFTMKMIKGRTLSEILDKLDAGDPVFEERYSLQHLLEIFLKVCDAIAFAHSHGIIHLDLKPENIQVGDFGEVLVLDWGLAKQLGAEHLMRNTQMTMPLPGSETTITLDGVIKGTPEYMAPEQATGKNSRRGRRTDIYALGAILYSILTFQPPVDGDSVKEIIRNVVKGNIVPPRERNVQRKIPQALQFVAYKAMDRSPKKRYSTVAELKADVEAYMNGYATVAEEAGFFTNAILYLKRKRSQVCLAASIFLSFFIVLSFFVSRIYYKKEEKRIFWLSEHARMEAESRRAGLEARMKQESVREWQIKYEDAFKDPYYNERWSFFRDEAVPKLSGPKIGKYVTPTRKGLNINSLSEKLFMKFHERLPNSEFRMIMEFTWIEEHAGGYISIHSDSSGNNSGYIFSMHSGTDSYVSIRRAADNSVVAEAPYSFVPGYVYKVDVQSYPKEKAAELKVSINGKNILSAVDDSRGGGFTGESICAFSFADASATLHSMKIMTLGFPLKADLLDIARRQLEKGNYKIAEELFNEIEESSNDGERRLRASEGIKLARLLSEYKNRLSEWNSRLKKAWPGANVRLLIDSSGFSLYASGSQIRSLTPLKGLPLVSLHLDGCLPKDLTPLRGMELKRISLTNCEIQDLTPLRGMPLVEFTCISNPVKSLEPLSGMPIRRLTLANCGISDLNSLSGMPLVYLDISRNRIADLTPIANSPIEYLNATGNVINSLEPLRAMPLATLLIGQNEIVSLGPIAGKNITVLNCDGNEITSLMPLSGMPLEKLDISNNRTDDISMLSSCVSLKFLRAVRCGVSDLAPLANLTRLETLILNGNKIYDVAPLTTLRFLRTLSIAMNRIDNLTPLSVIFSLQTLNCSGNSAESVEPLDSLALDKLICAEMPLRHFGKTLSYPPRQLFLFERKNMTVAEVEKLSREIGSGLTARKLSASTALLAAFKRGDTDELKRSAKFISGKLYTIVPVWTDVENAKRYAAALGASLPMPKDLSVQNQLMRIVDAPFWLGMHYIDNKIMWDDGSLWMELFDYKPRPVFGFKLYKNSLSGERINANYVSAEYGLLVLEWPSDNNSEL